jgi:hypothetical protein
VSHALATTKFSRPLAAFANCIISESVHAKFSCY